VSQRDVLLGGSCREPVKRLHWFDLSRVEQQTPVLEEVPGRQPTAKRARQELNVV